MALLDSTAQYHCSTRLYFPTLFNHSSIWQQFTFLYSTLVYFTVLDTLLLLYLTLYLTLPYIYLPLFLTTVPLLNSTRLYYTLPFLYLTLLHSTVALLDSSTLYYGSTLICLTLLHCSMALLDFPNSVAAVLQVGIGGADTV